MDLANEFALQQELEELRQANYRLERQLRRTKQRNEDLVDAVLQASRDAWAGRKIAPIPVPKRDARRGKPEVALWHLTDWQGAKVTTSYNSEIMRRRVMEFCEKAVKITDIQRADHPVRECVIAFGGDMVEGLFNFATQPFEIDATLFGQFVNVSSLLIDTVRYALANYEKVTVVSEWGNHGRIGSKRDAVPRADNIDRMCYEHARQMLASEKRLTWEDSPEDMQRIEIGNYRALVIHGDEIGRNGFASRQSIVRHVNQWRSGAYPWQFQDVFVGHYHVSGSESLADGRGTVYWTGSTESDNRYARDSLASGGLPSQRLHFVDPTKGRTTAEYRIWLT